MPAPTPAVRTARPRRYLMCRPTHFEVGYSINPWMDPDKPVDNALAVAQWERLREAFVRAGHTVELIDPIPGLPDMVYAANGATVVDGKVLGARFRNRERVPEGPAYLAWFRTHGFNQVHEPRELNEGEGDYLTVGPLILAGHGFRSSTEGHREAEAYFGRRVIGLELIDPRYYHLDTALAVLDEGEIMYHPSAFAPQSRTLLRELFPDALTVDAADAATFALNIVSDGRNVFLPETAQTLATRLRDRGFHPHPIDLSELRKGGGSIKCCTLELRP